MQEGNHNQDHLNTVGSLDKSIDRRKYPRERYGGKNEWKAVETHLGEVGRTLNRAEKDIRSIQTNELANSYDEKLRQIDAGRAVVVENRARDHEEMKVRQKFAEDDHKAMMKGREMLQNHLADNYEAMMDIRKKIDGDKKRQDLQDGVSMIDKAKWSLEIEKAINREKNDKFYREAYHTLEAKEAMKNADKNRMVNERNQHIDQMNYHAQQELLREANYRNFFKNVSDNQSQLQQIYQDQVVSPQLEKARSLDQIIARNELEYKKRREMDEVGRVQRHNDETQKVAGILRHQMGIKEAIKSEEQIEHERRVKDSLQKSMEYNDMVQMAKHDRKDQQYWYKDVLDKQKSDKDSGYFKSHAMTKKEKTINREPLDAYKDQDNHVTVLIPGYSNSKYIHPYSPEARYAHVLQHKTFINNPSKSGTGTFNSEKINKDNKNGSSLTIFKPNNSGIDLQLPSPTQLHSKTVVDHVINRSDMMPNTITSPKNAQVAAGSHNPITNPVPHNLQNPYLLRELRRINNQKSQELPRSYLANVANQNLVN